jgi:hypothetical protein
MASEPPLPGASPEPPPSTLAAVESPATAPSKAPARAPVLGVVRPGTAPGGSVTSPHTQTPETAGGAATQAGPPSGNAATDYSYLNEEPQDPAAGRAAGEDLSAKYGSGNRSGSNPHGNAQYQQRPKSPRNLMPSERPAVATLRHLMNAEEAFHKRHGRYASLAELLAANLVFLDVPIRGGGFQRFGFRFELSPEGSESFRATAMPIGAGTRPFVGDDSGYIRLGVD